MIPFPLSPTRNTLPTVCEERDQASSPETIAYTLKYQAHLPLIEPLWHTHPTQNEPTIPSKAMCGGAWWRPADNGTDCFSFSVIAVVGIMAKQPPSKEHPVLFQSIFAPEVWVGAFFQESEIALQCCVVPWN